MEHGALIAARIAVGLVLVVAGGAKLAAGKRYVRELVATFAIVPSRMIRPVAFALPWVELILGGLLVTGLLATPVAALGAGLLGGVSLALALNLRRGSNAPCGCFGPSLPMKTSWTLVGRNLLMVLVLVAVSWKGGS
ncbi:MAG TPA: MauE/DoxX family redox-associated membrane protein [Candidatus Dormibacteraeota bacterium]|nr:MauE/DoxX family redox-associated membrane protein [Candidatus Dormibacteraeota bacterium]